MNEAVTPENSLPDELIQLGKESDAETIALFGEERIAQVCRATRFRQMSDYLGFLFAPYGGQGFVELRAIQAGQRPRRYFMPCADIWVSKDALKSAYRWAHEADEAGFDIYCGVLPRSRESGRKVDIEEGAYAWADIDYKIGGREVAEARVRNLAPDAQPDLVVYSGNGIHAYWELSEICLFSEPAKVRRFESSLAFFQQMVQPGSDPVQDLSRVLRLPGFTNKKQKENPRIVRLARVLPSKIAQYNEGFI